MNIRYLLVIAAVVAITGCKIEIKVPEGGSVISQSGEIDACAAGETCYVDVVDIFFDQTFEAVPAEGMKFTGWEKKKRGFCGKNMDPCRLATSGFEGNEALMPFLDTQDIFFLYPTFAADDAGGALSCEYTQSSPGGDFDVCVVSDNMTAQSCVAVADESFGGATELTSRDCAGDNPVGYCATDIGDIYYYEGSGSSLSIGCNFMPGGEWHDL